MRKIGKWEGRWNYVVRFTLAVMAVVVANEALAQPDTLTKDRLLLLGILGPILLLAFLMTTERFRTWCEK